MYDLVLSPSRQAYHAIINREQKLQYSLTAKIKFNFQGRRRRMKLVKQHREKALLKSEGGGSYIGGRFGAENTQSKRCGQACGRDRQTRGVSTGIKRKLKEGITPTVSSQSSGDASCSSDESTILCAICNQREPDPVALRRVGKKI